MKKLLSAVIVVCIFFSIGIVSAHAEGITYQVGVAGELEDAIASAGNGDTIVLSADITLENSIIIDKELMISFNGKSLRLNGKSITVTAKLTILDEAHIYGNSISLSGTGEIAYDTAKYYFYDGSLGKVIYNPNADPVIDIEEVDGSDGIHIVPVPPLPNFPAVDISSSYKNYGTDAPDLTFAMQFSDPVEISLIQANYYGGWYADFVVTVNKNTLFGPDDDADAYLAGHYAGFSSGWLTVPFSNVDYTANTPYALMSSVVSPWTVGDIYTVVQQFECGIHFTDEFIAKNPDLKVLVQLRISPNASDVATGTVVSSREFKFERPAGDVPATADNSHVALWAMLFVVSTAFALLSRKRHLAKG